MIPTLQNQKILITSVGLDGEKIDQITSLEKPEIMVFPGMYVLTALDTLEMISGSYEVLRYLPLSSPLGKMVLVRILEKSLCLVGGPSTNKEMLEALQFIDDFGFQQILIDGAFSRKANAVISDAIIYVVGSSYHIDPAKVIEDALIDIDFFTLAKSSLEDNPSFNDELIQVIDSHHHLTTYTVSSTLEIDHFFLSLPEDIVEIYLPKALTTSFAIGWMKERQKRPLGLVLKDPFKIQVTRNIFNKLHLYKEDIRYLHQVEVIAVCVNPYSVYQRDMTHYDLKYELQRYLKIPVFNVKEDSYE